MAHPGKMQDLIELSLQRIDGSSTKIRVEPGTTAEYILGREAFELPAGYSVGLVTETAEALQPNSRLWESQAALFGVAHAE